MTERRIEVEAEVRAERERVWEAWADPAEIARWFVDEARGRLDRDDAVTWIWRDFGLEVRSRVARIEPGRRFVLHTPLPDGGVRVLDVELTSAEGGKTRIRVVETGFGSDAEAEGSADGWPAALGVLGHYLERGSGSERNTFLLVAPTDLAPAETRRALRTADGLSEWLTLSGEFRAEGEPFRLELVSGGTITGVVLATTPSNAAVTWHEIDGTLELMGFEAPGGGRFLGLRASSWGDPPRPLDRERAELQAALDRLTTPA